MTNSVITLVAAIIAACAGITAATISALNARQLSKRIGSQKLAEFRKDWVENLRAHFAEFSALYVRVVHLNDQFLAAKKSKKDLQIVLAEYHSKIDRFLYVARYLQLMLNEAEDIHLQMIKEINQRMREATRTELKEIKDRDGPDYIELARAILKREWDRVNRSL